MVWLDHEGSNERKPVGLSCVNEASRCSSLLSVEGTSTTTEAAKERMQVSRLVHDA